MSLKICLKLSLLACKNSCFSSLLTAKDVLPGVTSVLQQQKFDTDDVTQCLHNKSGSHGVPNVNLFNFVFLLASQLWLSFVLISKQAVAKVKCFF